MTPDTVRNGLDRGRVERPKGNLVRVKDSSDVNEVARHDGDPGSRSRISVYGSLKDQREF